MRGHLRHRFVIERAWRAADFTQWLASSLPAALLRAPSPGSRRWRNRDQRRDHIAASRPGQARPARRLDPRPPEDRELPAPGPRRHRRRGRLHRQNRHRPARLGRYPQPGHQHPAAGRLRRHRRPCGTPHATRPELPGCSQAGSNVSNGTMQRPWIRRSAIRVNRRDARRAYNGTDSSTYSAGRMWRLPVRSSQCQVQWPLLAQRLHPVIGAIEPMAQPVHSGQKSVSMARSTKTTFRIAF